VYVLNTKLAVAKEKSGLPSSDGDFYYVAYMVPQIIEDLPSRDEIVKSSTTATNALIPTVGDVIELIPFLPVEINIPNVISSMMNLFNWIINRQPYDQTTPRIHFLPKKSPWFRNVFVQREDNIVSVPYMVTNIRTVP
jgi:hypothetical protein